MEDSHIKMDMRKESDVNQTNTAKDCKAQDSNGKTNASVETKEKPNPDLFPRYCDKDSIKGKVVLVVNETFLSDFRLKRKGAAKDLANLKYVFMDKLGFEQVNEKQELNLRKSELENVLAETARMVYDDTDLFVFAISTHGEERQRHTQQYEHALMCSDEEYVFTTDIIDRFSKIPSLAGKPKIFFIQACRIPYDTDCEKDAKIYDPGHEYQIFTKHENEETVTKNNDSPESEICGPIHSIHTVTKKVDECSLTENNDKAHAAQDNVEAGHRSENDQTCQPSSQDKADAGHRSENDQTSQPSSQDKADAGHRSENDQTSQPSSQDKADAGHRSENEGTSQPGSDDQSQSSVHFLSNIRCPKDCLVVYAIQSGKLAWRSEADGSWMFHQLHQVIQNYKQTSLVDFFDVLTKTAFGMAQRESNTGIKLTHGKKAVPIVQHRLTKHLLIPLRNI